GSRAGLAAGGVGDYYLDALELLQVGVAGRGHRAAERAHQVHRAVGHGGRAVQDLLQGADGADLDARAAGQFGVVGLAPPVVAVAGPLDGPGQRRADHHRVGPDGQRLGDVAAAGHRAVGDHVYVAAAGLV